MTGPGRLAARVACVVLALSGPGFAVAEGVDPSAAGPAPSSPTVAALMAEVGVERTLMDEDLARYLAVGRKRAVSLPRLTDLYAALDIALVSTEPGAPERARAVLEQIGLEEAEGDRARSAERELAERILVRIRRIALLEQQVASLGREVEPEAGLVTGVWEVVLLPFAQRGTFTLRQSGALVSGTYELDGGFRGSLQGTLVNRKVFLVRIDSKLGRSMELEGYLGADGKTIRGNWLNYELAGTEAGTGQWSATRR